MWLGLPPSRLLRADEALRRGGRATAGRRAPRPPFDEAFLDESAAPLRPQDPQPTEGSQHGGPGRRRYRSEPGGQAQAAESRPREAVVKEQPNVAFPCGADGET